VSDQPAANNSFENNKLAFEEISLTRKIFLSEATIGMMKVENITKLDLTCRRTKLGSTLNSVLERARALQRLVNLK